MGPTRNVSINILNVNVEQAILDGRLPQDNFIITGNGDIKVLSAVEQIAWQKLGHLGFVRQYGFNVNDDKLNALIDKNPDNPTLKANVQYLKLRGRLNLPSNEKPEQKELREKIQTMQKRLDDKNS